MTSTSRALRAQRLLLFGLVGTMALAALLLWNLRHDARGRGTAPSGAERESAARTLEPTGVSTPVAASEVPAAERAAVASESTTLPRPEDDVFDPGAITGTVVARGQPVGGAELRLFAGPLEHRERRAPLATTTSDAAGRFRFRGLAPHARHTVHVQHQDFLPEEETLYPGHAAEVELEPSARISGTVRWQANGQPVAGIGVALDRWHFDASGLVERVLVTTGADGAWALPWAEPGMQPLLVLRPGAVPERREFQVAPTGGDGYEILLGEGRGLALELYALEDGAPLRNTEVLADDVRVVTDENGRLLAPFAPLGASDGYVRIAVALPGGCVTQGRASADAANGVLRLPLTRGGSVAGLVVDAARAPVEGALVRTSGGGRPPRGLVLPDGFWLNPARGAVRSDADGRFTISGLPPREGELEVRAQHPEHPTGQSGPFPFVELGQRAEVEIVLERGGLLEGRVTLDGEPAALRVHWNSERGSGWTRANDRGDYRLAGLPSGEISVGARLDDEDEDVPRTEDRVVWVEEDGRTRVDFELTERRALIRGRVVDALGAPVSEAEVVATLDADEDQDWVGEEPRAESDGEGRFELSVPDTPGLAFDVWAESGPRHVMAEDVLAGAQDLELVLPALAQVALRVVDAAAREPVQGFQVYWRTAEDGTYERLVQGGRRFSPGPDGTFLAELPAGRLDLAVAARAQGYVAEERTGVDLFGGMPVIEFELERGVELDLEVRAASDAGTGLSQLQRGRTSIASDEQWADRERGGDYFQQEVRNAQSLRVDGTGVARVTALPSGRYRFFNAPKGFVFEPAEFDVPPVAHHRVVVDLVTQPEKRPKDRQK